MRFENDLTADTRRHDEVVDELNTMRDEPATRRQERAVLSSWLRALDEAWFQYKDAPVEVVFVAQVGRGKSTLIAAATSLQVGDVAASPMTWSVLPVDRGRTTLGELRIEADDRQDIEVEVTDWWDRGDLERELRLLGEDTWAKAAPSARGSDVPVAGAELENLLVRWVSGEDDVVDGLEQLEEEARRQNREGSADSQTARQAFCTDVVSRARLDSRGEGEPVHFSCDEGGMEELRAYLKRLNGGQEPDILAPRQTTIRLPRTLVPNGVDALVDTQGLEARASGILFDAREDILGHLEAAERLLVVCSAYEDAPDFGSVSLLKRALELRERTGSSTDGQPEGALVIVDKEVWDGDAQTRDRSRKKKLRECQRRMTVEVGALANSFPARIIDAKHDREALRSLLSTLALGERSERRARWHSILESARNSLEPLRDNLAQQRLRALDLQMFWRWEAGLVQGRGEPVHPLHLLALAIRNRDSKHVEHWSHLNAAARRSGSYSKLDLPSLAGRLAAVKLVRAPAAAWRMTERAIDSGAIGFESDAERDHAKLRLDRMRRRWAAMFFEVRVSVAEAVRMWFRSDEARPLWRKARRRWGEGHGYVDDFAELIKSAGDATPSLLRSPPAAPIPDTIFEDHPLQLQLGRVFIENFRRIESIDLVLTDLTVLVGDNGVGKTATLDAVAVALWPFVSGLTGQATPTIDQNEPRVATFFDGESSHRAPSNRLLVSAEGQMEGRDASWERSAEIIDGELHEGGNSEAVRTIGDSIRQELRHPTDRKLPLVAYYRLERRSISPDLIDMDRVIKDTRLDGYRGALQAGLDFTYLTHWIRKQTYARVQRGRRNPQLEGIEAAVAACLPDAQAFRYDIAEEELLIEMDDGRVFPLRVLSSGYQSVIALVADIAWRASVLNPQLLNEAPKRTEGIVLIDEIDLHLHPRWQRQVLLDLQRTFPNLQFIVTTHSPQVVASIPSSSIRILRASGDVSQVDHSKGVDSNTLLREVFGDGGYPRETVERIGQVRSSIANEDTHEAERLLSLLEKDLGDMSDMVRTLRWELADAVTEEE